MTSKVHHLGEGWQPHVDEIDGKLIYSIPVESSFVSISYEFEITKEDLFLLKESSEKYKLLFDSLHSEIQDTFGPSLPSEQVRKYTQTEFEIVKRKILYGSKS